MVKPFEVNINEIELDNINEKQRKEIEKETNNLNGIDNLFALVIALVLAITFINGLLSNDNFSYMMLLVSLLGIITIIYIRYARSKQKKKLKVLLEQTTLVDQKVPIKIVNYHEKAHTIAMYALLISLIFSLINSILDIMYK
ncbi:TPA: hypothetical protein ACHHNH_002793 [Staphylococcus aureus]